MSVFNHFPAIFNPSEYDQKNKAVILEIGVHHCEDSFHIMSASKIPAENMRYFAFEPDPRNTEYIQKHRSVKNYLELIGVAVGSENKYIELYQSSGNIDPSGVSWTGSSSIKPPKHHLEAFPWCRFEQKVEVPMITLDYFCQRHMVGKIDFIWCDIQGAEADMVKGGQNALAYTRYLYCEYSDHELYEGQVPLSEWMKLLPGNWEIVEKFAHDVLLVNKDVQ